MMCSCHLDIFLCIINVAGFFYHYFNEGTSDLCSCMYKF